MIFISVSFSCPVAEINQQHLSGFSCPTTTTAICGNIHLNTYTFPQSKLRSFQLEQDEVMYWVYITTESTPPKIERDTIESLALSLNMRVLTEVTVIPISGAGKAIVPSYQWRQLSLFNGSGYIPNTPTIALTPRITTV